MKNNPMISLYTNKIKNHPAPLPKKIYQKENKKHTNCPNQSKIRTSHNTNEKISQTTKSKISLNLQDAVQNKYNA
jgi:hypothetical protein